MRRDGSPNKVIDKKARSLFVSLESCHLSAVNRSEQQDSKNDRKWSKKGLES